MSAVQFQELGSGIVQITMADRLHKNMFSEELISGLLGAYARVGLSSEYKVVILTGYGNYFACGATKESLLRMCAGETTFADSNVYSLALDCRIPVIGAMQGHSIGGGFVMGLYCDLILLSRESVYTTNFMKYGFTPGMGATLVLPHKLGFSLAYEFLLAASTYRGAELETRGIPFLVCSRRDVLQRAVHIAQELAEKPRESLVMLKDHLVKDLRNNLPEVIEQEVAMHARAFRRNDVREKIQSLFDPF